MIYYQQTLMSVVATMEDVHRPVLTLSVATTAHVVLDTL